MSNTKEVSDYISHLKESEDVKTTHLVTSHLYGNRPFTAQTLFERMEMIMRQMDRIGIKSQMSAPFQLAKHLAQLTNDFTREAGYMETGGLAGETLSHLNKFSLEHRQIPLDEHQLAYLLDGNLAVPIYYLYKPRLAYGDYQLDIGTQVTSHTFENASIGIIFRPIPKIIAPDRNQVSSSQGKKLLGGKNS